MMSFVVSRFGSAWFSLCCLFGSSGLGRLLALPFFVVGRPRFWVWRSGSRFCRGRWVRRWPPRSCGRGSASSGFVGRWVCVAPAALAGLRLSAFVWWVCPAVVGRVSGSVFRVWVFVSPAPCGAEIAAVAAIEGGCARGGERKSQLNIKIKIF